MPLRDGVVLLDELPGVGDYPEGLYALDRALQERHWWYRSRRRILEQALAPWVERLGLATLLEVGCGTGFSLAAFEGLGLACVGLDMSAAGLALARERVAGPLLRSGATTLPLADPVDVVALIDVLEHTDEQPLLEACRQVLRPGGLLLLSVPARPSLWSLEDTLVGHRRRYTRQTLVAALDAAGFELLSLRPFHSLVTVLAMLGRLRAGEPRRSPGDPLPDDTAAWLAARRRLPGALTNRLLGAACTVERWLGRWLLLAGESHLLALARRTGDSGSRRLGGGKPLRV